MLWARLAEVLLMSTHNICFCGEIRKYLSDIHPYLDLCAVRRASDCTMEPNLEIRGTKQNHMYLESLGQCVSLKFETDNILAKTSGDSTYAKNWNNL